MANSMQSVDPTLLALQTAKTATENAKKKVLPSLSTQVIAKPSLNVQTQQPQAISAPPTAKVGGISSPFGATNINSSPILGGATPTEIKETATELQSLPKTMPETGATEGKKISKTELKAILDKMPDNESRKLAITKLQERGHQIEGLDYEGGQKDNFITNLGSGIGQSVAGFGNLGKKLAFGAVDLYRQSQGKEKLTPEQRASVESTPMGQALNTITNRQTPEQKASVGGQIGMVAGSVAQGAALGTPISNAVSKIPGVANIVSKAPVLSKIAGGIGQGLEGQALYSLSAEGKLPTGKELFTAGAFGGAVNAIGPIAKGIKENIKKLPSIKGTSIASKADDRANQMLTNMNRITKGEQEKFAVQQGKTVGQRLNDKGIVSGGEETIDALAKGFKNSIAKADEGLAAIRGNYKDKYLSTMANEAADFAENTLSPQASQIRALAQKADDVGLTMSETNEIKRFYERNNKFTYGKDITAGEKTVRATNLDNLVREWQLKIADENGLSNLREINKDTQGYRELLNKLIKNENGRLGNNAVTLTDWIVAGEVASNPSALALLVGKKIGGSKWFRSGMVKILNRLSGHTNEADKIIDIGRIMQIQDEKDLNKFLSLPLKQNADNFTPTSMNSASSNQGMVKTPGGIIPPKPTPKTPPITVEKGAIGMGTTKPKSTTVLPPKPTVAPSVGEVKIEYNPGVTDISSYSLKEYSNLVKQQYPGIHSSDDISRMYNTLVKEGTIKTPKVGVAPAPKGFKGLGKEVMEQDVAKIDDLMSEAKKYKSAEEFRNAHQSKSLLDLSDPKRQRWGRLLEDGVDEDTGKYMDLTYTTERYADQYKYYPDSKVPKVTNPNQEVTIYRGTTTKQGDMMPGDFVTFSKDYALSHNEGAKLLVKKVPAKDVVWQGNDFSEWIYSPESMRGKTYNGGLEKVREQANKKTLPPLPKKGK